MRTVFNDNDFHYNIDLLAFFISSAKLKFIFLNLKFFLNLFFEEKRAEKKSAFSTQFYFPSKKALYLNSINLICLSDNSNSSLFP